MITQISHSVGSASALGTSLFFEDFEDGAADWNLDGEWTITQDGDNHYLQGLGDSWAVPKIGEYWTDYTVTLKIKRQAGTAHLNIRMNDDRGRYIIGFIDTGVYLRKETP
ncbi:MAG: hypothetical protein GWN62_08405, partial [Aliifodinibius sp.]|nr:hypothetical protein [Fodinibius sp.]